MLLTAELNDCRAVPGNTDPVKYKLQPLLFFFFFASEESSSREDDAHIFLYS